MPILRTKNTKQAYHAFSGIKFSFQKRSRSESVAEKLYNAFSSENKCSSDAGNFKARSSLRNLAKSRPKNAEKEIKQTEICYTNNVFSPTLSREEYLKIDKNRNANPMGKFDVDSADFFVNSEGSTCPTVFSTGHSKVIPRKVCDGTLGAGPGGNKSSKSESFVPCAPGTPFTVSYKDCPEGSVKGSKSLEVPSKHVPSKENSKKSDGFISEVSAFFKAPSNTSCSLVSEVNDVSGSPTATKTPEQPGSSGTALEKFLESKLRPTVQKTPPEATCITAKEESADKISGKRNVEAEQLNCKVAVDVKFACAEQKELNTSLLKSPPEPTKPQEPSCKEVEALQIGIPSELLKNKGPAPPNFDASKMKTWSVEPSSRSPCSEGFEVKRENLNPKKLPPIDIQAQIQDQPNQLNVVPSKFPEIPKLRSLPPLPPHFTPPKWDFPKLPPVCPKPVSFQLGAKCDAPGGVAPQKPVPVPRPETSVPQNKPEVNFETPDVKGSDGVFPSRRPKPPNVASPVILEPEIRDVPRKPDTKMKCKTPFESDCPDDKGSSVSERGKDQKLVAERDAVFRETGEEKLLKKPLRPDSNAIRPGSQRVDEK